MREHQAMFERCNAGNVRALHTTEKRNNPYSKESFHRENKYEKIYLRQSFGQMVFHVFLTFEILQELNNTVEFVPRKRRVSVWKFNLKFFSY